MPPDENLTGSILVAHPALVDPNFRKTVLFISQHAAHEGATGIVLNRPLGEVITTVPGLPEIPVFSGGPVATESVVLASLQWRVDPTLVAFRAFSGRLGSEAVEDEWIPGLRAFAGYSGWSEGQLEREIQEETWVVVPPTREIIEMTRPEAIWKSVLRQVSPMLHLLSDAPDEPWKN